MSLGIIIGGLLGCLFGGPWNIIFGAWVGYLIEENFRRKDRRRADGPSRERASDEAVRVFCVSSAAMLAKMAKADGRITRDEIEVVEEIFRRLGFSSQMRSLAVKVFRQAKDDDHSIYAYANDFASTVLQPELRVIFYEMLWDLACADGTVSAAEDAILRRIPGALGIPAGYYIVFANEHGLGDSSNTRNTGNTRNTRNTDSTSSTSLAQAYAQLGLSPSASDDEVKKAYRQMAKKYHPDALRAQGLPETMIGKATERMSKINAAWAEIKAARGL